MLHIRGTMIQVSMHRNSGCQRQWNNIFINKVLKELNSKFSENILHAWRWNRHSQMRDNQESSSPMTNYKINGKEVLWTKENYMGEKMEPQSERIITEMVNIWINSKTSFILLNSLNFRDFWKPVWVCLVRFSMYADHTTMYVDINHNKK